MNLQNAIYLGNIHQISRIINTLESQEYTIAVNYVVQLAAFLGRNNVLAHFFSESTVRTQTLANIAAARNNHSTITFLDDLTTTSTHHALDFTEICKYLIKYSHVELLEYTLNTCGNVDMIQLYIWASVYGRANILLFFLETYMETVDYIDMIATLLSKRGYTNIPRFISLPYTLEDDDEWYNETINSVLTSIDDFEKFLYSLPSVNAMLSERQLTELYLTRFGLIRDGRDTPQELIAIVQACSGREVVLDNTVDLTNIIRYSIKYGYDNDTFFFIHYNATSLNLHTIAFYAIVYNRIRVLKHIIDNYDYNNTFISNVISLMNNQEMAQILPVYQVSDNIPANLLQDIIFNINHVDYFVYLIQQSFTQP
jgi:hypothetical protein